MLPSKHQKLAICSRNHKCFVQLQFPVSAVLSKSHRYNPSNQILVYRNTPQCSRCLNCMLLPHLMGNQWKAIAIAHYLVQSLKNALTWKLSASSSCTVSSVYIIQIHLQNGTCFISPSQKMGGLSTRNSCFNIPAVAFFILENSATPNPSLERHHQYWLQKTLRQTHAWSIFSKVYRLQAKLMYLVLIVCRKLWHCDTTSTLGFPAVFYYIFWKYCSWSCLVFLF